MKRLSSRVCAACRLLAAGLAALATGLAAQQFPQFTLKDFQMPEFYPAPHQTQLKSLLRGAEAVPQPGDAVLVRRLKAETFRVTGEREMEITAPQCLYDRAARTASSAGPIAISTADGRIRIQGEGFLWQQTNSVLIISNRVHTVIRLDEPKKTKP